MVTLAVVFLIGFVFRVYIHMQLIGILLFFKCKYRGFYPQNISSNTDTIEYSFYFKFNLFSMDIQKTSIKLYGSSMFLYFLLCEYLCFNKIKVLFESSIFVQ